MSRKIVVILGFLIILTKAGYSQRDAQWILGYNYTGIPQGTTDVFGIDFHNPTSTYLLDTVNYESFITTASICDSIGNLLFYSNGIAVMNAVHDTMSNGDSLNRYCVNYVFGNDVMGQNQVQSMLILPSPGSTNLYYLIHQGEFTHGSTYNYWWAVCDTLYYSIVDMNLNGGLGEVTIKNQPFWVGNVATRMLAVIGSLTACKHANGRDWWIVSHRDTSSEFMNFLLTPQGISGPSFQNIGPMCFQYKAQSVFSRDGTKYAFFDYGNSKINLFDFDRCTGQFSNYVNLTNVSNLHYGSIGTAFSPNSRYLYTSLNQKIVQWDTYSSNIALTKTVVAVADTFYCPNYAVCFNLMELNSNGKIYVSSPNSSYCLSVIENPDVGGLSCNVIQHGFTAPRYIAAGIPNHPNFDLGPISGSACDSLTSLSEYGVYSNQNISIIPNPASGNFQVKYLVENIPGELLVQDNLGRIIFKNYVSPWTNSIEVHLPNVDSGLYLVRIIRGQNVLHSKILIESN